MGQLNLEMKMILPEISGCPVVTTGFTSHHAAQGSLQWKGNEDPERPGPAKNTRNDSSYRCCLIHNNARTAKSAPNVTELCV